MVFFFICDGAETGGQGSGFAIAATCGAGGGPGEEYFAGEVGDCGCSCGDFVGVVGCDRCGDRGVGGWGS